MASQETLVAVVKVQPGAPEIGFPRHQSVAHTRAHSSFVRGVPGARLVFTSIDAPQKLWLHPASGAGRGDALCLAAREDHQSPWLLSLELAWAKTYSSAPSNS
jgi:hypothetical protein